MKTFAIVCKPDSQSQEFAGKLENLISEFMVKDITNPDLVISIGGDGTMLYSVHQYIDKLDSVSFIGIHTGTLGFLTDYLKEEYLEFVEDLQNITPHYYYRDILEVTTDTNKHFYALNEVRLENSRRTLVADIKINDELFEHFRGTGLCISTSAGSTGYNKSLGGAIVKSTTPLMQLTEIAGISSNAYRSLSNPLILQSDYEITLEAKSFASTILGYDHLFSEFKDEKKVHIQLSDKKARFAQLKKVSYFQRLKRSFL